MTGNGTANLNRTTRRSLIFRLRPVLDLRSSRRSVGFCVHFRRGVERDYHLEAWPGPKTARGLFSTSVLLRIPGSRHPKKIVQRLYNSVAKRWRIVMMSQGLKYRLSKYQARPDLDGFKILRLTLAT